MAITWEIVVGACILIMSIISAITSMLSLREKVNNAKQPYKDEYEGLKKQVEDLSSVAYHELRAIRAMLNHMIDGNDIEALEAEYNVLTRLIDLDEESHQLHI